MQTIRLCLEDRGQQLNDEDTQLDCSAVVLDRHLEVNLDHSRSPAEVASFLGLGDSLARCSKSNQRLPGGLFDVGLFAADFSHRWLGVELSLFRTWSTSSCLSASNDIPQFTGSAAPLEGALDLEKW